MQLLETKIRDLSDFQVRRVLPDARREMVGPFIFFDHMGPTDFAPGAGIQVRPHPHIGLSTVTYLFDGEIIHRDSLGVEQAIVPGEVNLMTAGRGIVHSERAGPDISRHSTLHGIQTWMALPEEKAEIEPAFTHYGADQLPQISIDRAVIRVIAGQAYDQTSPVECHSPTLYVHIELGSGGVLNTPDGYPEVGIYLVSGDARIDNLQLSGGSMAIVDSGLAHQVVAQSHCRIIIIGGYPVGPRHIYWNFVSSSKHRIELAKEAWKNGQFDSVPGDDEYIPLP